MTRPWNDVLAGTTGRMIGRRAEAELIVSALSAGRDLLLEGPPGTSKSTLLRAVAAAMRRDHFLVEGSALLTPARLAGRHDPAAVLRHGYRPTDFVDGPLVAAMKTGSLLYLEEINRVPEDTLNLLLGPLAERRLEVPRSGTVHARPGFAFVAAMNPHDEAGTSRLSRSITDRLVRISLDYQPAAEERSIVAALPGVGAGALVSVAVRITRATREHPEIRAGASVRGAIDLARVAMALAAISVPRGRREPPTGAAAPDGPTIREAAILALSGRIVVDASRRTAEELISEIVDDVLELEQHVATGDHALSIDNPIRSERPKRRGWRDGPARTEVPNQLPPETVWPRPGRPETEPRVFLSNQLGGLSADRVASGAPVGKQDGGLAGEEPAVQPDHAFVAGREEGSVTQDPPTGSSDALDGELLSDVRRLARRIVVKMARRIPSNRTGGGRLATVRYHHDSDDLDLDRTLEEIAGVAHPAAEDLWVVERVRARRAYALLLDVSGSMRGEQIRTAAVATAAVAAGLVKDDLAVVAFWRDAAILKRLDQPRSVDAILKDIVSLRARGLTNLTLGLQTGLRELSRSSTVDRIGILLSDCGHNVGDDPLEVASRFAPLHVIGTSTDGPRVQACRELARRGGGRTALLSAIDDIPDAVTYCLAA